MTETLNYFLEANLVLLVVLAIYLLFLRKETQFRFMRIFLISGIVAGILFPLVELQVSLPTGKLFGGLILDEIRFTSADPENMGTGLTAWDYTRLFYGAGFLFMIIRMIHSFLSLMLMMKSAIRKDGLWITESNDNHSSFSFFNFVYIGQANGLSDREKKAILEHERIHASRLHTADLLLIEVVRIFFWFNPFLHLYKMELIKIHEFQADEQATGSSDPAWYCQLLARMALRSSGFSLASHFHNSLTIKRICMIKTIKNKINPWKKILVGIALPLIFLFISCQDQPVAGVADTEYAASSEIHSRVDEMPAYPGGFNELVSYVQNTLKYPLEAREKGIEGKVFIEFVVEKDGTLSSVKIQKGAYPSMDKEALRVVENMRAWNPGLLNGQKVRTKMVLPIAFKL